MFKGYIPTRGKKPIETVKGKKEFYTLQQVEALNEYGGVLSDDYIMIDVDNMQQATLMDKIINDLDIKCGKLKTSRGMHFYFKNDGVKTNKIGCILPVGLEADIKLGIKNTVVPLKLNGELREVSPVSECDIIPIWLKPIGNAVDFYGMTEGDGRNQALFDYILKLQGAGYNKDQAKETIELINKYVLRKPLDARELETILRDESFNKIVYFDDRGKLIHHKFAEYLVNEYHIRNIDNVLHIYNNGVYVDATAEIERKMIAEIPNMLRATRQEILSTLELIAPRVVLSPPTHLVLGNGLYNINTKELEDFTPQYVSKNRIATNFNKYAVSKDVDKVLKKISCNDKSLQMLLEEVVGYTLLRRNELGKAFILTGHGSNGKSTFLDMINNMIGKENISSLSLQELGQRFKTAELYGKLVNIGDDIPNSYMEDNSVFKKLATGEPVNVERKGRDPFDFTNYAKLIFSANDVPRINDASDGLLRRLVLVPFNAKFKRGGEDFDPFIKDKLLQADALEYLLQLGINGLHRVLGTFGFTEVLAVNEQIEEYRKVNTPIYLFTQEEKIINESIQTVYDTYRVWCLDSGVKALSKTQFCREMSKLGYMSKVIKKNKESIKIYVKKDE